MLLIVDQISHTKYLQPVGDVDPHTKYLQPEVGLCPQFASFTYFKMLFYGLATITHRSTPTN